MAERIGILQGRIAGFMTGCLMAVIFCAFGIGMYAGARFVLMSRDDNPACINVPTTQGCFSGGQVSNKYILCFC